MTQRSLISFVLEQAILHAIQNPPQPVGDIVIRQPAAESIDVDLDAPSEQPFDFLAYHDALSLIYDVFEKLGGVITGFDKDELLTQEIVEGNPNNIYHFNQNHLIEPSQPDDEWLIVNHEQIILTHSIAPNEVSRFGRLMGVNNFTFNNNRLYKDKPSLLVQPFELTTFVKPGSIKGISPAEAFTQNPIHPCFMHLISPAPVMGIALEENLGQLIGYVVHVKILYNLLNTANMVDRSESGLSLKNHIALQFDSQSALRMLNYRYRVDINQDVIAKITKFDEDIKKHSDSGCCIEIQ